MAPSGRNNNSPTGPTPITIRSAANLESLVDSEDGDLTMTVNGGRQVKALAAVVRAQIPYFQAVLCEGTVEAEEKRIDFHFDVASSEHLVSVLRWAHGGNLDVSIHALGGLYEVSRHLQLHAAASQLRNVALRGITTAEQLLEARFTDPALLSLLAHKVAISAAEAPALLRWALSRGSTDLAQCAASELSGPDALRIAARIPQGNALKDKVCSAAAASLVLSSFGERPGLNALSASSAGAAAWVGALLATRPGAVLLQLGSGARVHVASCPGWPQTATIDPCTYASILKANELWVPEMEVFDHIVHLLRSVGSEHAAAMRPLFFSSVRFSHLPTPSLAAARDDLPSDMLCDVLLARLGHGSVAQASERKPTARALLALAGAVASFSVYLSPRTFAMGKVVAGVPGIYLGKDVLKAWWPIEIVDVRSDGTCVADVNDGATNPRWSRVLRVHMCVRAALKQRGGSGGRKRGERHDQRRNQAQRAR
eukprot:TRINITY_DN10410_c0_g1_i1.p1 TRINITY_DN10410_c0_g1~~TRINITY_DN10410_c0_g1_i1.p1  ORF type:complete len:512 (+),score=173.38 TRINITY_DN10410_c0_g1_i1:89-1537(+)